MTGSAAADLARAEVLVQRALGASPRLPPAHLAKGMLLHARGDPEQAIPEYETVVTADRNWVNVLLRPRHVQVAGWIDRGDHTARRASHPLQPARSLYCQLVHADRDRASAAIAHDEAIGWPEKALS